MRLKGEGTDEVLQDSGRAHLAKPRHKERAGASKLKRCWGGEEGKWKEKKSSMQRE